MICRNLAIEPGALHSVCCQSWPSIGLWLNSQSQDLEESKIQVLSFHHFSIQPKTKWSNPVAFSEPCFQGFFSPVPIWNTPQSSPCLSACNSTRVTKSWSASMGRPARCKAAKAVEKLLSSSARVNDGLAVVNVGGTTNTKEIGQEMARDQPVWLILTIWKFWLLGCSQPQAKHWAGVFFCTAKDLVEARPSAWPSSSPAPVREEHLQSQASNSNSKKQTDKIGISICIL